jgi:hypothetical protein
MSLRVLVLFLVAVSLVACADAPTTAPAARPDVISVPRLDNGDSTAAVDSTNRGGHTVPHG